MESTKKHLKTPIEEYVVAQSKSLRIKEKMTQADLAHKLNVSDGFIGKVESSKSSSKYNLNHINLLAEIFRVSPQYFLPKNKL